MKLNEGRIDRTLRIIFGLFLISLAFWGPKSAWGWIGLIPLVTGITGYCPLYSIFKLSTRKAEPKKD